MLDIEIFAAEKPIYAGGKEIGTIPHISLGTYTRPNTNDQRIINKFYEELAPAHRAIFNMLIHQLGELFFASSLVYAIDNSHHPIARQKMLNLLHSIYPHDFVNREELLGKQDQILKSLHNTFRPTHMVAMMIEMKNHHDVSQHEGKITDIQDEIFARGIAKCVQSIQDLPEKEKTPQIQRFCKRGTHRWKQIQYED